MMQTMLEIIEEYFPNPYPRLMKSTNNDGEDVIVLFYSDGCGTVVSGPVMSIGLMSTNWVMKKFSDFNGVVKLRN
jgi:hypothetical protein